MSVAFCCSAPKGPRSLARPQHAATIAPPCPSCPIWRSSRTPSTPRSPAGPIVRAEAPAPLAVRGTPAELRALVGQSLREVRRRGKFIVFELDAGPGRGERDADRAGSSSLRQSTSCRPSTAVILGFGPRATPCPEAGRSGRRAPPGCRRTTPAPRSAIATRARWARSISLPAGVARPVTGLDDGDQGPDADSPELTLEVWRERIRRHPGELKSLLRNQAFVAGIGNAYSDEILHAAKLSPFRRRSSLAPEEIDALYEATRTTLARAIDILRERVPPTFEKQVRDFLAVHRAAARRARAVARASAR